ARIRRDSFLRNVSVASAIDSPIGYRYNRGMLQSLAAVVGNRDLDPCILVAIAALEGVPKMRVHQFRKHQYVRSIRHDSGGAHHRHRMAVKGICREWRTERFTFVG